MLISLFIHILCNCQSQKPATDVYSTAVVILCISMYTDVAFAAHVCISELPNKKNTTSSTPFDPAATLPPTFVWAFPTASFMFSNNKDLRFKCDSSSSDFAHL